MAGRLLAFVIYLDDTKAKERFVEIFSSRDLIIRSQGSVGSDTEPGTLWRQ